MRYTPQDENFKTLCKWNKGISFGPVWTGQLNKSHSQLGLSYLDEWTGHGWIFSQISFRRYFPINFILKQVGCRNFCRSITCTSKNNWFMSLSGFLWLWRRKSFFYQNFQWHAHLIMSWEQNEHKFDSILSKFFRSGSMTILRNVTTFDSV